MTGDTSDSDGDSIPLSAKLILDCHSRRLGYTGTLSGLETVNDTEPDAAAWSFTADSDVSASLSDRSVDPSWSIHWDPP